MWPVAVIHGIGTGTDPRFAWMLAIEAVCIGGVVTAVAWRVSRVTPTAWRQAAAAPDVARKWN
jgi:sulfoxide reductase heme-binding subunit YedZ